MSLCQLSLPSDLETNKKNFFLEKALLKIQMMSSCNCCRKVLSWQPLAWQLGPPLFLTDLISLMLSYKTACLGVIEDLESRKKQNNINFSHKKKIHFFSIHLSFPSHSAKFPSVSLVSS